MTEKRTWRKDYCAGSQETRPNLHAVFERERNGEQIEPPPPILSATEVHEQGVWYGRQQRAHFMDARELLEDAQADIEELRTALRDVHQIHSAFEVGPQSLNNISKLFSADRIIWDALHEIPKEK